MKKLIILSLFLTCCFVCNAQTNNEKEKEAIKKVLLDEAKFFAANDAENLLSLHVQDSTDARLAGTNLYVGWDNIKALLNRYIDRNKKNTTFQNPRNKKENLIIKVNGNSAWAVMDNIWLWEEDGETKNQSNYQISFLEKIDGQWKFSFNAFVPNKPTE